MYLSRCCDHQIISNSEPSTELHSDLLGHICTIGAQGFALLDNGGNIVFLHTSANT